MIFYYILWAILFGFIIYGRFFRKAKPIPNRITLNRPIEEPIKVGELYNVGMRETIFFGKNKGETVSVRDAIITVLELNVTTLEDVYATQGFKTIYDDIMPTNKKYMCHLVFYDCRSFYVADFYWSTKHIRKFDQCDA